MDNLFLGSLWLGIVAWSLLYISDYAFTIVCARLYRQGADKIIVFEGSYELNPFFQKEVDSLRTFSPRFLAMLLISNLVLAGVWGFFSRPELNLYPFVLGAFVLLELMIHTRHLRNFFLFSAMRRPDWIHGQIQYRREHTLRMSSNDLFAFAGLYLFTFAFVPHSFLLGGVFSCALNGLGQRKRAAAGSTAKS